MPPIDAVALGEMPSEAMTEADEHRSGKGRSNRVGEYVTVKMSREVKNLIDGETERTGETAESIIERAVLNLFRSYSCL